MAEKFLTLLPATYYLLQNVIMRHISHNEKETQKTAMNFAKKLTGGEVILMYGDLGAGKTVFVKGLAKALGVREVVKSPTFNIMKCYKVKKTPHPTSPRVQREEGMVLCHIDAYRLKNFDDLVDIGADEYLGKENVISVIEWAERIEKKSQIPNPKSQIKIKIRHGKEEDDRIITID